MTKNLDLSIVILSFNTKVLLEECLRSVTQSNFGSFTAETIVVDNSSTDQSPAIVAKKFPEVTLIALTQNLGFAAGNNIGIKKSQGRYVLLLNSDTRLNKSALKTMIEFMDKHAEAGAVTCKLLLTNGQMDPACHRGFPTPWASLTYFVGLEKLFPQSRLFGQYHEGYKDLTKVHEIDSPSGAFFLIRREAANRVGLLDEDFFMYGEDLDWAYRLREAGFKIFFNPVVTVLHRKKQSGRANIDPQVRKETERYFFDSMRLFYKKHYEEHYGWLVTQLVLLGIKLGSLL